jgi:electron transfer flavoprotein alpha subunit
MRTTSASLLQLINQGRTHAIILAGDTVSSRSLAEETAANLLAIPVADLYRHPNYLCLTRPVDKKTGEQKAAIPVDAVTEFCARLALSSFGAGKKIAVIEDADALNSHGQNALLKTLEEPKGDTLILLLTAYPDRLLPTIRSRATSVATDVACHSIVDSELAASVAEFCASTRLDRLLQAVALTKGDDFISLLAQSIHTTFLAKCATLPIDTQQSYAAALSLLANAPRQLRNHANPTLIIEEIALALP